MDGVRYAIGLLVAVLFPAGMSMWFVIHPFAAFWRRRGPLATYLAVIAVATVVAVALYHLWQPILSIEYGFSWPLTAIGVVLLSCSVILERRYRRDIEVATLLGLPEVSVSRESALLTQGVYGRIRHPRYVGLVLEISAFALFANYLAAYLVILASAPMVVAIVVLEERELLLRFGDEYRRYMSRVPRFIPRRR